MAPALEPQSSPKKWPPGVIYLQQPQYSKGLTIQQLDRLRTRPTGASEWPTVKLPVQPSAQATVEEVLNAEHPANGQHGLFARKNLDPGTFVVAYLGWVHSNLPSDTDADSDYDLSLDREAGVSVDATKMGTEARFVNDYRGIKASGPNAEFRDIWLDKGGGKGEKGLGIFVLCVGKSGKGKGGIRKGEEIVMSYGKGFWLERLAKADVADEG